MFKFDLINNFELFGLISSLILCAGLYQIGTLIFKVETLHKIISQVSEIKYQKIFISINFLLLIFYPIILYSDKINLIPALSILIFSFGLFKIFLIIKKKFNIKNLEFKKNHIDKYLVFFGILGLFLLSLSPNTHGDSLGYHFVVAKKLLSSGNYFSDITHFHSLLAGSGEIIIAIGLFFGSEQLGALIQFSGLLSIFGIFKKIDVKQKYFFFLLALTSPIILFLSSTAKPQLFHICSSVVIFSLFFLTKPKILTSHEEKWKIFLSLLVLTASVLAKFNFILSSFLIGMFIFYTSLKNSYFKFFLYSSVFIFSLFFLPIILWKFINFGGNLFQYLYSPVPLHIIGFEEFSQYLSQYGRNNNFLSILLPSNFSQFTNSIGIAFCYILFLNFKNKYVRIVFLMSLTHLVLNYFYGQFIGRSFLEPFFWILLTIAKFGTSIRTKLFESLCRIQSVAVIIAMLFGVVTIFPGSLSKYQKDKVLSKNANGYSLFKWANTKLEKEDVLFSNHRSISLGNSQYIASDFVPFVNFDDKRSRLFSDKIKSMKPNFLLTYGYLDQKPFLGDFKDCVGKLKYYKDSVGKYEARNPLNRGRLYDGYIYEFKISNFPECISR